MNKKNTLQEEKRAAFRRFSKMGAAGLAVLSISAFTDLSAQGLPDSVKLMNPLTDTVTTVNNEMLIDSETDTIQRYGDYSAYYTNYTNYSKYCNYNNYGNYSNYLNNYSNNYGDTNYSNNYTNNYSNTNYSNSGYSNLYTDGI